jgi:hypothetical protein
VGKWSGYLSQVDPDRRLKTYELEIAETGETIDEMLERFILDHRHELELRDT